MYEMQHQIKKINAITFYNLIKVIEHKKYIFIIYTTYMYNNILILIVS